MTNEEAIKELYWISDIISSWAFEPNGFALLSGGPQMPASIKMAISALEKQITKPPVPDMNARDRFDKPVPRCQVCGYGMTLQTEQYCPYCGQKLVGGE